jgi:tripartite-type tricarboxylate transporter receptor subunit TctC
MTLCWLKAVNAVKRTMRQSRWYFLASLVLQLVSPAFAAEYPSRVVRIIVPYPAGGGPDVLARAIADRLSPSWRQPIVIENRAGGGTLLGAQEVVRSAADGYTIFITDCATMTINPLLYKKLPYDPDGDFIPVTQLVRFYQAMLANPAVPASNLAELVAYAKANPAKLSYGSYGVGSQAHLSGELFKHAAGIEMQHVPYRGAEALLGATRGEVQLTFAGLLGARSTSEAGQLKVLAIGGPRRSSFLPNAATFAEQGYPTVDTNVNFGVFLRSGTPGHIVERINRDIVATLKSPDFQQKYLDPVAFEPVASSPSEFSAFLDGDSRRRRESAEIAGIRPAD